LTIIEPQDRPVHYSAIPFIEEDDALRKPGQVGDDELHTGIELARVPFDFGDHPTRLAP
jgi:hypothetical protein